MNIPPSILSKIGKNLYLQPRHPISIIKKKIFDFFDDGYSKIEGLSPYVSTEDNFDLLLISPDHPSRSKSDTYYVDETTVLRTHTSAHQNQCLKDGLEKFLIVGDVYRKDEIDSRHYPVFHQMEGVCLVPNFQDPDVELHNVLIKLVEYLFPGREYRFNKDYFPFTEPSYEIEVKFNDTWVEILGCGVIHSKILEHNKIVKRGWAFGLGLERLAMILFDIPDIRLFWCEDEKFLSQFKEKDDVKFVPYSKLNKITKDISFWINDSDIHETNWTKINDFYEMVREICGDNVESVDLFDKFKNSKTGRYSNAYRLTFSPNKDLVDPSEFNDLCNDFMKKIYKKVVELDVEPR